MSSNLTTTLADHQALEVEMSNWEVSSFTDWSDGTRSLPPQATTPQPQAAGGAA